MYNRIKSKTTVMKQKLLAILHIKDTTFITCRCQRVLCYTTCIEIYIG